MVSIELSLIFTGVLPDDNVLTTDPMAKVIINTMSSIIEIQMAVSDPSIEMKKRLSILVSY